MKQNTLPPGQVETKQFSRYGLFQYAGRTGLLSPTLTIRVTGEVARECYITRDVLGQLERVQQTSDFHCVTTWSKFGLHWSGYRFKDLYKQVLLKSVSTEEPVKYVIFRSQDNYRTWFQLEDLLADDVLLADTLNGEPLSWQHGAPIRLVAPAHYGFKSAKHLAVIELRNNLKGYKSPATHWTEHPRARVACEERGRILPGIIYRYVFRAFIPAVRWWYSRAEKKSAAAIALPDSYQ